MSNRAFSIPPADYARSGPVPARPDQRQPRAQARAGRARPAKASFGHYLAKPLLDSGPLLFAAAVLAVLFSSWLYRNEGHLTPENGAGYWLGIAGSSMMLTLMLYPLRKRLRFLHFLGKVPSWFRWHMILGILGPSLILIHSNWKLASLNASVATFAMLIVAGSGIVGRYLYSKVHMGLYGRKTEVRQILADASMLKEALGGNLPQMTRILDDLRTFESLALAPQRGFLSQAAAFLTLGIRRAMLRGRLLQFTKAAIAEEGKRRGWSWSDRLRRQKRVRQHIGLYFAAVTKAARFSVYDRLLALWHVLHLPLFFLLVAAAIIHIIAVHLY